ncbi:MULTISPECIES: hypothetical protein [Vagococcus]|uniref:hypothetical protein n=1 Tax=Vagococcus TaxID=2737 RepID=UPI000E5119DA|nr:MULTISPECIES: hypothetical protein [Vagococcus]RHH67523.1 hypothetical protein DW196_09395 [Vagococcus sp. AM17-17]
MPINYSTPNYEYIEFNYDAFFNDLSHVDFFKNKEINHIFLTHWKTLLVEADIDIKENFHLRNYETTEHFPTPLFFYTSLIGASAINIDRCEEEIFQRRLKPNKMGLEYFCKKEEFFKLDVPPYEFKHPILYNHYPYNPNIWPIPVIIFDTDYSNHAVTIDGNHRISYCLNINSSQAVESYIVDENFFKDESFFMDKYSFLLFTFWKEIHFFLTISNKKNLFSTTKKYNRRNILQHSYLSNIIEF